MLVRTTQTDGVPAVPTRTPGSNDFTRPIRSERPRPNGPDLHPLFSTRYEYNPLGEQTRSWQDINGNNTLDLAGPDRITETTREYVQAPSDLSDLSDLSDPWWRVSRSHTYNHGSSTPTLLGTSRQRLTGLGTVHPTDPALGLLVSESLSIDIHGNTSTSRRYLNRATQTAWSEQYSPFSTIPATSLTIGGLLLESHTPTPHSAVPTPHSFDYDAFQRRVGTTDPRTGRSFVTCHEASGLVIKHTDAAGNETHFGHDSTGRQIAVTDPEGNTTHTAYTPRGQVAAQWGATYPVVHEYDDQGRMTKLHTLRDPNHSFSPTVSPEGILTSDLSTLTSQMDTTEWIYEESTGLLQQKLYADNKGPSYTYTPDGRLHTRTWARGLKTVYGYDTQTHELTDIDYFDANEIPIPQSEIRNEYDRLGPDLNFRLPDLGRVLGRKTGK